MSIKNLHKIERPRERLQKYGAEKLADYELLAILLRTGPRGTDVLKLSKKILRQFPGNKLAQSSIEDLSKIRGVGPAKACEIISSFELGRRMLKDKQWALILSPREIWDECKDIRESKKEHFVVFFLDTQNQAVKREVVSVGTLNASLIHPREVFEPAVQNVVANIIIAHNHPSSSLEPSEEDIQVTKRLADAGRIMGIEILDHVIVTKTGYTSFKEKGLL